MNRRSLLLGGVVASVAGILGVKAEKPVTFVERWDSQKTEYTVTWDELRNTPEYQELLVKQIEKQLSDQVSGYQVNQLMAHGTPPMFPEPQFITEKYPQTWEQVDPLSIYPEWRGVRLTKVTEINHDTDT